MSCYRFHASLHSQPPISLPRGSIVVGNRTFTTFAFTPGELETPFNVSFEETSEALARLKRMVVEPDGSFVWRSSDASKPWQVDGVLYDRRERLWYVELKGDCPADEFNRLLAAFGWPEVALMFQLTREAVFVDEWSFCAIAAMTRRGLR